MEFTYHKERGWGRFYLSTVSDDDSRYITRENVYTDRG